MTTPRKRRPHPARRGRRLAGAASVTGLFAIGGAMAIHPLSTTTASQVESSTSSNSTKSTVVVSNEDDGSETIGSATPATQSTQSSGASNSSNQVNSQPITSSRGS